MVSKPKTVEHQGANALSDVARSAKAAWVLFHSRSLDFVKTSCRHYMSGTEGQAFSLLGQTNSWPTKSDRHRKKFTKCSDCIG